MMRPVRFSRVLGIALLAAALAMPGATAAAGAVRGPSKETAASFALRVLKEATIPAGARETHKVACGFLSAPATSLAIGDFTDLHKLYLVPESVDQVENYVEDHLAHGAKVTSTGNGSGPQCSDEDVEVTLPLSGENEYLAELIYTFAPIGTGSELRVDSQTVWVPNRPAGEVAPNGGLMEVTGFSAISDARASSGAVTVRLTNSQAQGIRTDFDVLPRGPRVFCLEDSLVFEITVRSKAGLPPFFTADGDSCGATVLVSDHDGNLPPLYDRDCSLLKAVARLLPPQAEGTRVTASECVSRQG